MKSFFEIQQHPSYLRLPVNVQNVLRITFTDPERDIVRALREASPRAARATEDLLMDTVKKLLSNPDVQILTMFFTYGVDLYLLRGAPNAPQGVEL